MLGFRKRKNNLTKNYNISLSESSSSRERKNEAMDRWRQVIDNLKERQIISPDGTIAPEKKVILRESGWNEGQINELSRRSQEIMNAKWRTTIEQLKDGGYMGADGSVNRIQRDNLLAAGWTDEQIAEVARRARIANKQESNNNKPFNNPDNQEEARQIKAQIAQLEARLARTNNQFDRDNLEDLIDNLRDKLNQSAA
ncbi:hypothetical protein D6827_00010 [Candidatus Parcubacteria bacterium]|nr:MAG: hypothetical protein D6827_00010 [Candidatus Parcubacteria bacterium]